MISRRAGLRLLGVGLSSITAFGQPGRWSYLGEANVDGAIDHDRIAVTGKRGEFRAIRLKVERAPVDFDRVLVHFANGSSDPIHLRDKIAAGGETRVIDLPGGRRTIQSVEFWYAKARWGSHRPKIRLFGLH